MAVVLLALLVGCAGGSDAPDAGLAARGQAVFADVGSDGGGGRASGARTSAWRIVLASFRGDDAVAQARAVLPEFRRLSGLTEAFVEPRSNGAIIAYGSYRAHDDRAAQQDLRRVRSIRIDGQTPFSGAFLAPPQGGASGANPDHNLANARQQHGQSVRYTLQIGVYESDNRSEAMRLAEQAASVLRQEGELAFYYHGPNRSMVTIGVFSDEDFNPATGRTSRELEQTRQRHPEHLYNGMGVRERLADGTTRNQRSQLVRIP